MATQEVVTTPVTRRRSTQSPILVQQEMTSQRSVFRTSKDDVIVKARKLSVRSQSSTEGCYNYIGYFIWNLVSFKKKSLQWSINLFYKITDIINTKAIQIK